ncbi:putative Hydroxyproline-rich glycofamily protein [Hibiscus syriacus]|uniref:Hydroxyproline-rich glycofamily protein n=1 Tax=Hibiscus syriacus TaxID=106335 RepID=A0A6A3C9L1_HIBSY|nr:uncharacterized protein LOC120203858 [Hibiscus syriacus]KAE8724511.1 putative Hydroxyproline-rich glycofamily protein [Hibiscus syriacus]
MDNMNSSSFQSYNTNGDEDTESLLTLRLSIGPTSPLLPSSSSEQQILQLPQPSPPLPQDSVLPSMIPIPQPPPLPIYSSLEAHTPTGVNPNNSNVFSRETVSHSRPPRGRRRNSSQTPRQGRTESIPPPFPWATSKRATVHTLDYLLTHNITTISGEVQCKRCERIYTIEYDLLQKFREISDFIRVNRFSLHDRAPSEWTNPNLPSCETCGSPVKPVVTKKRSINWLFLLLGKMLGCCKLTHLKYFCKHTRNHKTAAKDRVLYLTYVELCKQLDPTGPFDI